MPDCRDATRHVLSLAAAALAALLPACSGRPVAGLGDVAPRVADSWAHGRTADQNALPDAGAPDTWRDDPLAVPWVTISAHSFYMGSPDSEPCRLANETRHRVTLTRPFAIGQTEVTQASYSAVMGENPTAATGCGLQCPQDSVSWHAAAAYSNRLSDRLKLPRCYLCSVVAGTGQYAEPFHCWPAPDFAGAGGTIYDCPGVRLPTEAEWELAYRAGSSDALHNGGIGDCLVDAGAAQIAWHSPNAGGHSHPVARLAPNAWGLHDMAGNLWEWVNDWYLPDHGTASTTDPVGATSGSGKVLRGGAWIGSSGSVRAASRNLSKPYESTPFIGFRVARTL